MNASNDKSLLSGGFFVAYNNKSVVDRLFIACGQRLQVILVAQG